MLYTGWGGLAPAVFFVVIFGVWKLAETLAGHRMHLRQNTWVAYMSFIVAGAAVWFVGRLMNRRPLEVVELHESGRKVVAKPKHTIYGVRMEYWGPIFFLFMTLFFLFRK